MRREKPRISLVIVFVLIAIIFFAFVSSIIGISQSRTLFNELEPFLEVLSIIRSEYIEKEIDIEQLVPGAIKGMLLELGDPYSRYMDQISFQREQENLLMPF